MYNFLMYEILMTKFLVNDVFNSQINSFNNILIKNLKPLSLMR